MAGDDLRPLQDDEPVDYDLLACPDCGRVDCRCDDGDTESWYREWDAVDAL